ncbi:DUF1405 domain-containing protein [Halocalculus aciditolerans]|uniref:DUF1405 domain-containing protein n=1 Tax=Halocalculus aciditolerans TaxID=1383812 RepID=A0A830FFW9_9EURY|nr:DUF1405 domain-containing protein [Halocalculus aciditolerans]GGL51371.1 hypothetical protein GCM10009039_07070 [Halocalculus aciditolerans]
MAWPDRESLPWYVAPLPERVEDLAYRLLPLIVLVNLVGTAFGFYYYIPQLGHEPLAFWPLVPDSPTATFFIAMSLLCWYVGRQRQWLDALAFMGCIKLGFWTPFTLLLFKDGFAGLHPLMYNFLFWSHLAMTVEAFVVYRYSDFRVSAVAVAVAYYLLNDVVDYFVPLAGTPHHTVLPPQAVDAATGFYTHPTTPHLQMAAGAVVLTVLGAFLALATRAEKLEARAESP